MTAAANDFAARSERHTFLSTEIASRMQGRWALAAALVSAALFVAVVPFVTRQLIAIPAFIPAYEAALVTCDLMTAALLFGQFSFLRARGVLVLASGYLFTAFIALVHLLTFPGAFSPTGLLGANTQTTAWLYMLWHSGFPVFAIAYAMLKEKPGSSPTAPQPQSRHGASVAIAGSIAATAAIVAAFALLATTEHPLIPPLLANGRFTPALYTVVTGVMAMSLVALVAVGRLRPYSVLDLWLMVVICAWLADIALSAGLNGGRYDVGWYVGRMYGLGAASSLLVILLLENGAHYPRLARLSEALGEANKTLESLSLHDALTGLGNRRHFDLHLAAQVAIASRHRRNLSLILCDVDAFKAYNDEFGHQAGDECLRLVAGALRSCCRRPGDLAARYGGEEFALILPDTDVVGAGRLAEEVGRAVAALGIAHPRSSAARIVSVSGGVAQLSLQWESPAAELVQLADRGLYEAKGAGRNRFVRYQTDGERRREPTSA